MHCLTFMTSTCRSSWSDGVTRTASNIWLSSCFSRTSASTKAPPTNLSSHSSFWAEQRPRVRTQKTLEGKNVSRNKIPPASRRAPSAPAWCSWTPTPSGGAADSAPCRHTEGGQVAVRKSDVYSATYSFMNKYLIIPINSILSFTLIISGGFLKINIYLFLL